MKKKRLKGGGYLSHFKRVLLIMKLTIFLIFSGLMTVSASIYSQATKLTLKLDQVSIVNLFKQIEDQSEFVFIYKDEAIDPKRKVDVKAEGLTVNQILDDVFNDLGLKYEIIKKQIIVTPARPIPTAEPKEMNMEDRQKPPKRLLKGTVFDSKGQPVPGATVMVKGSTIGTITDFDGNFSLDTPSDAKILLFSFIGMKSQEVPIGDKDSFIIKLETEVVGIEEVVAIGYGQQKKSSVVGAITTTTSKELRRTGGVNNIAMALAGQLPGVATIQTTGQPGREDPKIYIRGQSTWNGGEPYILVDGVERRMNDLDMNEVDNISVLKDASATAVYGVKGANGVILITTKRGAVGKPVLTVSANSTMKIPSRLVDKLDAYDTYHVKDQSIAREVVLNEAEWVDFVPETIINRYRNQQNLKYPEAYPNINWRKETIKDFAMDHHVNMNVSGGTDFAKYFSSLSYMSEGDLIKTRDNGKGYDGGLGYDRFNFRSNLDLNLTRSTVLKINLAGMFSIEQTNYAFNIDPNGLLQWLLISEYFTPSNAFMPKYSDGRWGASVSNDEGMINSLAANSNSGVRKTRRTDLTTDFTLTQKLDFITKGLNFNGNVSFDNHFESEGGIVDGTNKYTSSTATKWINPAIEDALPGEDLSKYIVLNPTTGANGYSWVYQPWVVNDENADNSLNTLRRRLYYQAQLNYSRIFGLHDITATGVFTREQLATGSEFQRFREDWVFRTTYNYDNRYFAEFNGAYNGSEKFGPNYRFAFFPSAAIGWTISNEKFLKDFEWLNKLKLRYSYGLIGDDGINQRWLYDTQWAYGGNSYLSDLAMSLSPYTRYRESVIGNPDIHWEKAKKTNLGIEMAVLNNMFSGTVEYFKEDRTDILLAGASRVLPAYFGGTPPTANVGRVKKDGYEAELRFNKNLSANLHLWANVNMTHAVDKIITKEEPQLKDPHLLAAGFQIDQTKSLINDGFYNTWDEVYASTALVSNDQNKLPGDYNIIDFDADGVIDNSKDCAPYGYSTRPQNTCSLSLGADYKGFSFMVQFYGVNNVTRLVTFNNFISGYDVAYAHTLDAWSKDNLDATSYLPRWKTTGPPTGNYFQYDASYLRLKTAEIAYVFSGERIKRSGMSALRVFLNGNNLIFWSKLPDDKEQGNDKYGGYPNSIRINLGVDIKF